MNPDIFGYTATTLNVVMLVPQVYRTWKIKQTKDLSLTTLVMFLVACLMWVVYGTMKSAFPLVIANIIVGAMNVVLISFKVKYK